MASLRIDIFTIFPQIINAALGESVIGRGQSAGILDLRVHDIRNYATDKHQSVDDAPFGGGAGMVMMAPPIFDAVEDVNPPRPLICLSPSGRQFNQAVAEELFESGGFSLLCGRYEGIDERVTLHLVDDEISVGDVVLAGGEVPALLIVEATARLVPGVLGNQSSVAEESFSDGLLEFPQYTRPATFRGWDVPEVLRSGDHGRIQRWRRAKALRRTIDSRPDLMAKRPPISDVEWEFLEEFGLAE